MPEQPGHAALDVLAVGAHPDDVELGCGGSLARMSREGLRVGICDLTRGELATRGDSQLRRHEAEAAARVLGVGVRLNLELPDGAVSRDDPEALSRLVALLRQWRPRLLLLPPEQTRHPDHGEASRLGQRAAFMAGVARQPGPGEPHRPGLVACYMERWPFEPSFVIDVSADHARRSEAIACYGSQFTTGTPAEDEPHTFISRPEFLEELDARLRHYGALAGVRYAEPFLTRGLLAVTPEQLLAAAEGPA